MLIPGDMGTASFVLAGAVVTRLGDAPLAAHQIAFQLWIFLALVLDAVAIAGQIIVGQELGAERSEQAFAASVRMIWLSIALGAAFTVVLPPDGTPRTLKNTAEHEDPGRDTEADEATPRESA